jgi:hypothetical protein
MSCVRIVVCDLVCRLMGIGELKILLGGGAMLGRETTLGGEVRVVGGAELVVI